MKKFMTIWIGELLSSIGSDINELISVYYKDIHKIIHLGSVFLDIVGETEQSFQ